MVWIALEPTVFDHRKTLVLSIQLGQRETHLVGHLARLWTWALADLPSGMSAAKVDSNLAGTTALGRDGDGELVVDVRSPLVRGPLEERFRQHVARALYDAADGSVATAERPLRRTRLSTADGATASTLSAID